MRSNVVTKFATMCRPTFLISAFNHIFSFAAQSVV